MQSNDSTFQTVKIDGSLTFESALAVFKKFDIKHIESNQVNYDFQGIQEIDSSALAVMIEWTKHSKQLNKALIFSHIPNKLMKLIKIAGLTEVLQIENE